MARQMFSFHSKDHEKDGERLLVPRDWKEHSEETQNSSIAHVEGTIMAPKLKKTVKLLGWAQSLQNAPGLGSVLGDTNAQTGNSHFYTWNICLCCERKKKRSVCSQHHNLLIAQEEFNSLGVLYYYTLYPLASETMHKNPRLDLSIKPDHTWSSYRDLRCLGLWTQVNPGWELVFQRTICGLACLNLMYSQGATEPKQSCSL